MKKKALTIFLRILLVLAIVTAGGCAYRAYYMNRVIHSRSTGISFMILQSVRRHIGTENFTWAEVRRNITHFTVVEVDIHWTETGLTGIEHLTNITHLTIAGQVKPDERRINPDGLWRLERLPNLHTLRFAGYGVLTQDLTPISELRNLTRRLRQLEIVAGEEAELEFVPRIGRLDGIENFTNLEQLEIVNNRIGVGSRIIGWSELSNPLDITGIENLTNLRILNISGNRLSNLNELRNLTNLTHLNASNNELTDISALRNLTNLERVDLSGNWLTEEELRNNLPEHLINREGGEEWLQTQIAGQNFG